MIINAIIPKETDEQKMFIRWLQAKRIFYFSVPNGGSRHGREAVNLKKEGVVAGVPDVVVMLEDRILFVEMKRKQKKLKSGKLSNAHSKPSQEQIRIMERINRYKYASAVVAYGGSEAISIVESYIKTTI
ncbi:MAG: VRR-NUC domain-containing protein [Caldisericia bacterium]|nr:VRR-NUC domain-containing protein [Caldisericia bacterium]